MTCVVNGITITWDSGTHEVQNIDNYSYSVINPYFPGCDSYTVYANYSHRTRGIPPTCNVGGLLTQRVMIANGLNNPTPAASMSPGSTSCPGATNLSFQISHGCGSSSSTTYSASSNIYDIIIGDYEYYLTSTGAPVDLKKLRILDGGVEHIYSITSADSIDEVEQYGCDDESISAPGQVISLNYVDGSPPPTPSLVDYFCNVTVSDSDGIRTWTGDACYPRGMSPSGEPSDNSSNNNSPSSNGGNSSPQPSSSSPPGTSQSPTTGTNNGGNPTSPNPSTDGAFPYSPLTPITYGDNDEPVVGTISPNHPKIAVYLDGEEVEFRSWNGLGITFEDVGSYVVGAAYPSIYSSPLLSLNSLSNLKRITHAILQFDNTKGLEKQPESNTPLVRLDSNLGFTYWGNDGGETSTDLYRYDATRFSDSLYSSQYTPSQFDKYSTFKEPLVGTGWSYQISVFSIDDSFFNLVSWQILGKGKGLTTSNRSE